MDAKVKVFKRDDKGDLFLVQNLTMGEADFNWDIRLGNKLIIAAKNLAAEETLSPVLIPTMSEDKNQQLKLAHTAVSDVVDQANRDLRESAAAQSEKSRDFLCSGPNKCKEEGGREVSTNCS